MSFLPGGYDDGDDDDDGDNNDINLKTMILSKLLHLSVPPLPPLCSGNSNYAFLTELS